MRVTVPLLLGFVMLPANSLAQSADSIKAIRADLEELRQLQLTTLRELQEIRRIVSDARAPLPTARNVARIDGRGPALGRASAPITLIEFSDYHCPYCGEFFRETLPRLDSEYVKSGRVRFVYRDFPIQSLHPNSVAAAEAALCADEQGHFWEMHNRLFSMQRSIGRDSLVSHARALGLDPHVFATCLAEHRQQARLRRGIEEGSAAGVSGTPTFFIGTTEKGQTQLKVIRVINGAQSYSIFKRLLDDALASYKQGG